MRAFSEKRYETPREEDEFVVIIDRADRSEIRVPNGIRYIRNDNKKETFVPKLQRVMDI